MLDFDRLLSWEAPYAGLDLDRGKVLMGTRTTETDTPAETSTPFEKMKDLTRQVVAVSKTEIKQPDPAPSKSIENG
jgi:hypothetical protein